MKSKLSLVVVLFLGIFLTHHDSHSYHFLISPTGTTGYFFRFLPSMPVDFRVDGGSAAGGDALVLAQQSCEEWNSLPNIPDFCGNLDQMPTDITSANYNTIVSANDNMNDIVFDDDGSIVSLVGFPGVLGVAIVALETTGAVLDITIIVNSSLSNPPLVDIESTLTHELGHGWGLAHSAIGGISTVNSTPGLDPISPNGIPTMYPFNIPVNDALGRTLETDDMAAVLVLYGP